MLFICWDTDVSYNSNIAPMLSTCMAMGYSTTNTINNKIARENSIFQHTSVISEYSSSVTDSVTFF